MQMVIEGKWRVIDNIHIFPPSVKTREKLVQRYYFLVTTYKIT